MGAEGLSKKLFTKNLSSGVTARHAACGGEGGGVRAKTEPRPNQHDESQQGMSSRSQRNKKSGFALCSMRYEPVRAVNVRPLIDREPSFWLIGLAIGHHIQSPRTHAIDLTLGDRLCC